LLVIEMVMMVMV